VTFCDFKYFEVSILAIVEKMGAVKFVSARCNPAVTSWLSSHHSRMEFLP
jgi:hypothetical protein